MSMGPLLVLNIIAWTFYFVSTPRKQTISHKEIVEESDDKEVQLFFRQESEKLDWMGKDRANRLFIDFLDSQEIYHQETPSIWCEGALLEIGNPDDIEKFHQLRDQAIAKREYNGKDLSNGGWEQLHIDWLRLEKGYSTTGAKFALQTGIHPNEAPNLII